MIPDSQNTTIKSTSRNLFLYPVVLLFLFSLFFLWFFRKELFFSQFNDTLFIGTPEYFRSLTNKPGGLILFAGNYLIRFYQSGIAGPMILSSIVVIIFLLIEKIAAAINGKAVRNIVILVPSCLILAAQTDMDYNISASLGYFAALLFFLTSILNRRRSFITFIILFPPAFLVTGFYSFVYAGMFLTHILTDVKGLKKYVFSGIIIVLAILVPVISKQILYLQPWNVILLSPLQFSPAINPSVLFVLTVAYSIFLSLILKVKLPREELSGNTRLKAVFLILLVLSLTLAIHLEDADKQRTSSLERSVYQEDWDKIINQYQSGTPGNMFDEHYYCLALANKGILCDSLFRIPHLHGINSLILPREKKNLSRQIYFFYHIGLVREAHHLAYESMVNFGYTPEVLKFLIKTNIIVRKYAAAEKYINILKRTCLESSMSKYISYQTDTTLILSDPEITGKREMLPDKDFFIRYNDFQNLELMLLAKPDNMIALEYKMAILMLNKDLETLRYEVNNIKNAGFRNIPLHMEEALLLDKRNRPDLYEFEGPAIRPETENRFIQYVDETDKYRLTAGPLPDDFRKRWGNTYWYYFDFSEPN